VELFAKPPHTCVVSAASEEGERHAAPPRSGCTPAREIASGEWRSGFTFGRANFPAAALTNDIGARNKCAKAVVPPYGFSLSMSFASGIDAQELEPQSLVTFAK
jgi:hypothetical protein